MTKTKAWSAALAVTVGVALIGAGFVRQSLVDRSCESDIFFGCPEDRVGQVLPNVNDQMEGTPTPDTTYFATNNPDSISVVELDGVVGPYIDGISGGKKAILMAHESRLQTDDGQHRFSFIESLERAPATEVGTFAYVMGALYLDRDTNRCFILNYFGGLLDWPCDASQRPVSISPLESGLQ